MNDLFVSVKPEYLKPREKRQPVVAKPVETDNLESVTVLDDNRKRKATDENGDKPQPPAKLTLKNRHQKTHPEKESRICTFIMKGEPCPYVGSCKYSHDISEYLSTKAPDLGAVCHNFNTYGYCMSGLTCRFGDCHIDREKAVSLIRKEEDGGKTGYKELNYLTKPTQLLLRKKKYTINLKENQQKEAQLKEALNQSSSASLSAVAEEKVAELTRDEAAELSEEKKEEVRSFVCEPLPEKEKTVKLVDFRNKVYVAPLTTVGNLPFRRILKEYGADITCGEVRS
jgi:tRNA-dihydrouridine synthase 3